MCCQDLNLLFFLVSFALLRAPNDNVVLGVVGNQLGKVDFLRGPRHIPNQSVHLQVHHR
jgi:hypothetical protein